MLVVRIDKQSNWTGITHSYVFDMLHDIVARHGRVCVAIKDGDTEQKIVNLNRISYVYASIKIHFAAKKIFKILSARTQDVNSS